MTLLIPLDSFLPHSNKENEPSSLNGTAPPRRRRSTAGNPYVTRKKVPTKSSIAFSMTLSQASLPTIEEETSPTIRRILEATGCSTRQELLAKRAAQVNTNGSKDALKAAPNGAKSSATNGSKAATSRTTNQTNAATNGGSKSTNKSTTAMSSAKATNRSTRSNTNPKKKSKGMYLLILDYSTFTIMSLTQFFPTINSFEWIQVYYY